MEDLLLLCRKCFVYCSASTKNFQLTQCSHLFCEECVPTLSGTCSVCNTNDIQTEPITSVISPEIGRLLADVSYQIKEVSVKEKLAVLRSTTNRTRNEIQLELMVCLKKAFEYQCKIIENQKKIIEEQKRMYEGIINHLTDFQAQAASNNTRNEEE